DHAGAAAVRGVVDRAVPVVRPVPQVVDADGEDAALPGPADQRQVQRGEVLREDGDDVQAGHGRSGRGRRSAGWPAHAGGGPGMVVASRLVTGRTVPPAG